MCRHEQEVTGNYEDSSRCEHGECWFQDVRFIVAGTVFVQSQLLMSCIEPPAAHNPAAHVLVA